MILQQKIAFLKNWLPEKEFDIILLLWSKLLLHTLHNKNMSSDENVLLPEKKSLFKNEPKKKKRRKIDAINNFVFFHRKEILIVFYN